MALASLGKVLHNKTIVGPFSAKLFYRPTLPKLSLATCTAVCDLCGSAS